jgi:hypothetical protein
MAKQKRLVETKSGAVRTNKNLIKKPKPLKPVKSKSSGRKK